MYVLIIVQFIISNRFRVQAVKVDFELIKIKAVQQFHRLFVLDKLKDFSICLDI